MYRAALGSIENVTKLTTEKKKELHDAVQAALDSYKALGEAAPPALQAILQATTELIPVTKSFSAVATGMWTQYAAGAEDGKARMAEIAENAKLGWEEIGGVSRAMLEQIARDAEEKYAVALEHADHFTGEQIANFRRAAAEARTAVDEWGTATLEAYDAIQEASTETATVQIAQAERASAATVTSWHEAMIAVAAGQGTMGGTVGGAVDTSGAARASMQKAWEEGRYFGPVVNVSEANPRGTGPDFAQARLPGAGRDGHPGPALHGRRARAGTVRAERVRGHSRRRRRDHPQQHVSHHRRHRDARPPGGRSDHAHGARRHAARHRVGSHEMGAAQASDYLENKLIDHLFRAGTFAKPTALWVALFTGAPSDAGGGTEVSGGSYARKNLPPSDTNWRATQGGTTGASTGTGGQTANAVQIAFPAPTANWGTVSHFAIFDAPTAGNLLIWDALTVARPILNGDPAPTFNLDALTIAIA